MPELIPPEEPRKATIRSVAKLAGVAPSTVSHYLNQSAPLSAKTAQSVERAIAALNYRVNLGARGLRLKKTNTVGLVIPNLTTPYFGEIAGIIESALWHRGYQMLLCISERDPEREFVQVATLVGRQVDGILVVYSSEKSKVIGIAPEMSVPVVFVDRAVPGIFSVACDNFFGGQLAAQHLLGLGHRTIGLLCGEPDIRNVQERIDGFLSKIQAFGKEIPDDYIIRGRQELQLGQKISELLKKDPRPTAVFATNDIVALGAWRTLVESGYRIPHDLSIVGFDNIEMSQFLVPPLTTVAQPTIQIGSKAVQLLLQLIDNKDLTQPSNSSNILIRPTLQIRGSSTNPN